MGASYGKSYEILSGKETIMGFESLKSRWVEEKNDAKPAVNTICDFETALPGLPIQVTSVPSCETVPGSPKGLRKK